MREIIFRGVRKDGGDMVYGEHVKQCTGEAYIVINSVFDEDRVKYTWIEVDPETVVQYTCLKDSKGKRAFHKDIVEFEEFLYSIEWDEKRTGFYLADLVYLDDPDSEEHKIGSCISESVIKGNPWEHPHLLEGRKEK